MTQHAKEKELEETESQRNHKMQSFWFCLFFGFQTWADTIFNCWFMIQSLIQFCPN